MDPEQIREEIKLRRALIDRKLDLLAIHARNAKQQALRRGVPAVVAIAAVIVGVWAWKKRTARSKSRESIRIARTAAAFR